MILLHSIKKIIDYKLAPHTELKARGKFAPVCEIWGDIKKCFWEVLQ